MPQVQCIQYFKLVFLEIPICAEMVDFRKPGHIYVYIYRGGWSRVIKRHQVGDIIIVVIVQLNMAYDSINTCD